MPGVNPGVGENVGAGENIGAGENGMDGLGGCMCGMLKICD